MNVSHLKAIGSVIALSTSVVLIANSVGAAPIKETQVSSEKDYSQLLAFDPDQRFKVNHSPMDNILKYISIKQGGATTVAYQGITGKAATYVQQYKQYLESIRVSKLNRNEQLAYWLNVYNVSVIEKIGQNFKKRSKIKSLRGVPGMPGSWWSEKVVRVEEHLLSLEEIEQKILIEGFGDPRILYALCYGVKGTNNIGTVAFTGANVDRRLNELATNFVNRSSNVKKAGKKLRLNSLYVWNKDSLFGTDEALFKHLEIFADEDLQKDLMAISSGSIRLDHRFNWRTDAFRPRVQQHNLQQGGAGSTGLNAGS